MEDNYFSKWIKENFVPSCIVFATDTAKKTIGKNNLTPAEFLRPFGNFTNQTVHFSLGEKVNTNIRDFRLDFYDSDDYYKRASPMLSPTIENVLSHPNNRPDWSFSDIHITNRHIEPLLSKLKYFSFPWFNELEKTFLEFLHFNEYEMYQQPLAYVYICSITDNPDLVSKMQTKDSHPYLFAHNIYETSDIPVLIIILNDKSDTELFVETKDTYLQKFKNKLSSFYMLYWEINTQVKENNSLIDIWIDYIHKYDVYNPLSKKTNEQLGKLISQEERIKFKNTLFDFLIEYVIKILEKICLQYDNNITNKKRGFRNTLFSFMPKTEKLDHNAFFDCYQLNYIERQMYHLAIIEFYFGYYEGAKENLGLLLSDLQDKSIKHYNTIYEFQIICQFLSPSSSRTFNIDQPYQNYLKNQQYFEAFRALLVYIKMLEQLQRFSELPKVLVNAVSDLPTSQQYKGYNPDTILNRITPLLFEKVSVYYLLNGKKFRKYTLYTVLAGISFANEKGGDFTRYTLNCYGNVIYFIDQKNTSFRFLREYLNKQMGDLCEYLHYYEGGMKFFKNCLELRNQTSKDIKNQYDHLLKCIKEIKANPNKMNQLGSYDVNDLTIPEIDNSSLLIIEEQDYQIAEEPNSKSGWLWFNKYVTVPLKKIYINLAQNDIVSIRNLDNIIDKKQNFSNFYSKRNFNANVNNKIYVRFTMKNPLPFNLHITNVKLICDYTPINMENIQGDSCLGDNEIEYQSLSYEIEKLSMKDIELYCRPLLSGIYVIKGVEIVLDEIAVVRHYFNQQIFNKLYYHRLKKRSSSGSFERRGSTSSHPGAISSRKRSGSSSHRQVVTFNRKSEITFNILDDAHDVTVSFPKGSNFDVFKGELLLIPITIKNNSSLRIKSFCLFFHEEESDELTQHSVKSVLCDYIFKDTELVSDLKKPNAINEATVYVPMVPSRLGDIYIKILIKFEAERSIELEAKRYLIKLKVKESIIFNINPMIIKYTSEKGANGSSQSKRKLQFCLETTAFISNRESLSNLVIGDEIYTNKKYDRLDIDENNWSIIDNNNYTKLYNKLYFSKEIKENHSHRFTFQRRPSHFDLIDLPFIPNDITNDSKHNLTFKINKLLQKDLIMLTWNCFDMQSNRDIFGVFFYHEHIQSPSISSGFTREIIKASCQVIDINQYALDAQVSLVTFTLVFDKNLFGEISEIARYEVFVNDDLNEFNWTGLKKYKIPNKNIFNKETMIKEEMKLMFSCSTNLKGSIDINRIAMKIEFLKEKNKEPIVINTIPYPIILNIS